MSLEIDIHKFFLVIFLGIHFVLILHYSFLYFFSQARHDEKSIFLSFSAFNISLLFVIFFKKLFIGLIPFRFFNILTATYLVASTSTYFSYTVIQSKYKKKYRNILISFQTIVTVSYILTLVNKFFFNFNSILLSVYALVAGLIVIHALVTGKKTLRSVLISAGLATLFIIFAILSLADIGLIKLPLIVVYYYSIVLVINFAIYFAYLYAEKIITIINLNKNLEAKVLERTRALEMEKEAKTRFFINLAHETKTPLTLIDNYLEKYRRSHKEVDLQVVSRNIKQLTRMMTNFLDIQKLERGQVIYDHSRILDLSYVVRAKAELFSEAAVKKSIRFCKKIEPRQYVRADVYAVDRIINNLLDNAIKFTPLEGQIEVELTGDHEQINFIVKDSGPGMPGENIASIFEPYHQSSMKKSNLQGIGMGLNIVKRIVEELGGSISVSNREGSNNGACFTVSLPAYILKESEHASPTGTLSRPAVSMPVMQLKESLVEPGRLSILVVEDNIDLLANLQSELEAEYNFYYALDGQQALALLESIRPHLIISDIMMDHMDGIELLKQLPVGCRDIPFIFVTAKSTHEDKLDGLRQGAVDYLCKPFDMQELKAKINSLLEQSQARQNRLGERLLYALHHDDQLKGLVPDLVKKDPLEKRLEELSAQHHLSEREQEVVLLLLQHKVPSQISLELYISVPTVNSHIHNIYSKLKINKKTKLFELFHLN